ncbi:MAG: archaellin/type IV pilin N-terminal domain-containing protein [Candidatus Heimdallarchaeaceae archaeon]
MKLIKLLKRRKAVSPVIATILLISLVVVAGSLVYFLVVPMIQGSASISIITAQWFDTNSDDAVDITYITLQNTGTAQAVISKINITIQNVDYSNAYVNSSSLVGAVYPLEVDVSERIDIAVSFNPVPLIRLGDNTFRIRVTLVDGSFVLAEDNLKYVNTIEPLSLTVINPVNNSWTSGILDPQAVSTGGFKASAVTYDFYYPDDTAIALDQDISQNINTSLYPDDNDYKLIFKTNDTLNQSIEQTYLFGIDNNAIGITLYLNDTTSGIITVNQGQAVNVSWVLAIDGAGLYLQELIIEGDIYPSAGSEIEGITKTTREYIMSGTETSNLPEDQYTFTLRVVDEAGNVNIVGRSFNLEDNNGPTVNIITPANESWDLSATITIEVYASDPSGINENYFDIVFMNFTGYTFSFELVDGDIDATYNTNTKKWTLEFNTYQLADGNYSMTVIVYDDTGNPGNSNYDEIFISIENVVFTFSGEGGKDGERIWGPFYSRGEVWFYMENMLLTDVTVTKIMFSWSPDTQITDVYEITDSTDVTWLDGSSSPYDEDVEHPVRSGLGVVITSGQSIKLNIQFEENDKVIGKTFTFSFYIEELDGWEDFTFTL